MAQVKVLVHQTMVVEAAVVLPIQEAMVPMLKVVKVEMVQQHI